MLSKLPQEVDPDAYLLRWRDDRPPERLYIVACDDYKEPRFQNAALRMQQASGGICGSKISFAASAFEEPKAELALLAHELRTGLDGVLAQHGWFTVASIPTGPLGELRAVGVGSNKLKQKRAALLALALAMEAPEFVEPREAAELVRLPQEFPETYLLKKVCGMDLFIVICENFSAEIFQNAALTMQQALREFELDCSKISYTFCEFETPKSHLESLASELSTGLDGALSKHHWFTLASIARPDCVLQAVGIGSNKGKMKRATHLALAMAAEASPAAERKSAECQVKRARLPCIAESPGDSSGLLEVPATLHAQPGTIVENDWLLLSGLTSESHGALTINSLTSEDTVPLHTDTDPNNGYCNLWAAKQVCYSPSASLLLSHDTSRRILDGENIGFSYGEHVLFRKKHYAAEGLRRAVDCFLRSGCSQVIVVTKREKTIDDVRHWFPDLFGDRVTVMTIGQTDDVIILKQAYDKKCPVVSRDNYRDHQVDCRVNNDILKWWQDSGSKLQVRYSWNDKGRFVPDFDLIQPVLKRRQQWPCASCGMSVGKEAGTWTKVRTNWKWFCSQCADS